MSVDIAYFFGCFIGLICGWFAFAKLCRMGTLNPYSKRFKKKQKEAKNK